MELGDLPSSPSLLLGTPAGRVAAYPSSPVSHVTAWSGWWGFVSVSKVRQGAGSALGAA